MGLTLSLLFSCTLFLSAALLLVLRWTKSAKLTKQSPPGPRGWPLIGNILDLGTMPHQTLFNLRTKYGPLLWLKLGFVNTMVVQSANVAEQFFKNHDLSFCDRKCPDALTAHDYYKGSIAVGQYGSYWRFLRRLCTMELLVGKRVNETAAFRRKCVDTMLSKIKEESSAGVAVDLAHSLFLMAFNLVGNLMLSKELLDSEEGKEFFDATNGIAECVGKPNVADFLPFLKWLDPQGVKRNTERHLGKALKIVGRFVKERVEEHKSVKQRTTKDFLDALLEFETDDGKEGPHKMSHHNINIILLEMFMAGTETTSSTIEWAMAELFRCTKSMKKAKEELQRVVGPNRKVEESDIDNLPYLEAVVKETLRLHPPIPLLLPRNASEDTNFMGYMIPKDTQIFVNVWGIGRDSESWDDPLCFKAERFIGSNIEYKGQNYEFLPFGSGRRVCVGISLAHRMVHLALSSLVHAFDWDSVPETLDMNERMGISLRKLVPLEAIPIRLHPTNDY